MLHLERVSFGFNGRQVLRNVSITLEPGQLVAIIGPNGAGKSTLLKLMTGELRPSSGEVLLDGRALARMPASALASRRAVVPQASMLTFPFKVRDVVALGISVPGFSIDADGEVVDRAIDIVGIGHLRSRLYTELSGGERQQVQSARALCQLLGSSQPPDKTMLFLDEPTSNLDIPHQIHLMTVARDQARLGRAVVAVLHDLNLAMGWADTLLALSHGEICAAGSAEDVMSEDILGRLYNAPLRLTPIPGSRIPAILPHARD